jgi:hypothetical protein
LICLEIGFLWQIWTLYNKGGETKAKFLIFSRKSTERVPTFHYALGRDIAGEIEARKSGLNVQSVVMAVLRSVKTN